MVVSSHQEPLGLGHGSLPVGEFTLTSTGLMQFNSSGNFLCQFLAGDVVCLLTAHVV